MNKLNHKLNAMSLREKVLVVVFSLLGLVVLGYSGVLSSPVAVIRTYPLQIQDMQNKLQWNENQIQSREKRRAELAALRKHVKEREACFPRRMDIESVITDFRRFADDAGIVIQNIRPHRAAPLRMDFLSNLSPKELGAVLGRDEPVQTDDLASLVESHFGGSMAGTRMYYVEMSLKGNFGQLLRFIKILEHYDRFVTVDRLQMSTVGADNILSVKMDLNFVNYSNHETGPESPGACANVDQAMMDRIKKRLAMPDTRYGKADPFVPGTPPDTDIQPDLSENAAPADAVEDSAASIAPGGNAFRARVSNTWEPQGAPPPTLPDINAWASLHGDMGPGGAAALPEFDINGIIQVQGRSMISIAGYDQAFAQGEVIDGFVIRSIRKNTIMLEKDGRKVRYEIR